MHAFLFLYPMSKHNNNQKKKEKKEKRISCIERA